MLVSYPTGSLVLELGSGLCTLLSDREVEL
jgi:hypothetical protein